MRYIKSIKYKGQNFIGIQMNVIYNVDTERLLNYEVYLIHPEGRDVIIKTESNGLDISTGKYTVINIDGMNFELPKLQIFLYEARNRYNVCEYKELILGRNLIVSRYIALLARTIDIELIDIIQIEKFASQITPLRRVNDFNKTVVAIDGYFMSFIDWLDCAVCMEKDGILYSISIIDKLKFMELKERNLIYNTKAIFMGSPVKFYGRNVW